MALATGVEANFLHINVPHTHPTPPYSTLYCLHTDLRCGRLRAAGIQHSEATPHLACGHFFQQRLPAGHCGQGRSSAPLPHREQVCPTQLATTCRILVDHYCCSCPVQAQPLSPQAGKTPILSLVSHMNGAMQQGIRLTGAGSTLTLLQYVTGASMSQSSSSSVTWRPPVTGTH